MFRRILGPLRGIMSLCLYVLNTIFWTIPVFVFALVKLIIPVGAWRRRCDQVLNTLASNWIAVNIFNQHVFAGTRLDVRISGPLETDNWYLVLSNHQSWVDILVLQRIFHGKIPFLKFFLKKELFWVPILGQAWWALDFPFMQRYSKRFLEKHPHLIGKDFERTRQACAKFKTIPISVMSFVEGTRFTPQKHGAQQSPYNHLLKTKAGGIALVLDAMGEKMHQILDVTIVYPNGAKSFWSFLCGEIDEIRVRVRTLPITRQLQGDYVKDRVFRDRFHTWLNALWSEKDDCIDRVLRSPHYDCGAG